MQGVTATPSSVTQGSSTTVNVATVGKADGSTLNYAITGDTGSISTALTGTVTVNSNVASLTIATTDNSTFNADETCTVAFTPTQENACSIASNSVTITVANNATTGPQPPADTTRKSGISFNFRQLTFIFLYIPLFLPFFALVLAPRFYSKSPEVGQYKHHLGKGNYILLSMANMSRYILSSQLDLTL